VTKYAVNKGVGKSIEIRGLRAQYVVYAAGGLLLSFFLFFACSFFCGQWIAVLIALLCALFSLGLSFYLNRRFGEKGVQQYWAKRATPQRIAFKHRCYRFILVK